MLQMTSLGLKEGKPCSSLSSDPALPDSSPLSYLPCFHEHRESPSRGARGKPSTQAAPHRPRAWTQVDRDGSTAHPLHPSFRSWAVLQLRSLSVAELVVQMRERCVELVPSPESRGFCPSSLVGTCRVAADTECHPGAAALHSVGCSLTWFIE